MEIYLEDLYELLKFKRKVDGRRLTRKLFKRIIRKIVKARLYDQPKKGTSKPRIQKKDFTKCYLKLPKGPIRSFNEVAPFATNTTLTKVIAETEPGVSLIY